MKEFFLAACGLLMFLSSCEERSEYKQTYPLGKDLEWGTYKVGFKSISEYDYSRSSFLPKNPFRSVEFGLWYPAISKGEQEAAYIDYLSIFEKKSPDSVRADYSGQKSFLGKIDTSILSDNLSIITKAIHQAKPRDEPFPLIVYSGKANDPIYGNTVLFEFLAGHGYVVLSLPPKVPKVNPESMSVENLNDIRFAINHVKRELPHVDVSRMATVAYEIGGVSSVAWTNENANVKAHVSLQGAIGSFFGWSFSKSLYHNNLRDIKASILHFGSNPYEIEPKYIMGESTFETSDSLYNARRYFSFLENSVPLGVSSHLVMTWVDPLVAIKDDYKIDKTGIHLGYEHMLEQTLMFLDVYLKEEGGVEDLNELILNSHKKNFIKPEDSFSVIKPLNRM